MTKTHMSKYGKVAVLMGGWSGEREISLKSGAAVLSALQGSGVNAVGIDVDRDIFSTLKTGNYDRVFIALHGCGGEDGVIQGGLETIGLPYTGSGVMASSICMNKLMTKKVWQSTNVPTPKFICLGDEANYETIKHDLGSTFIVKPSHEGSSLGIHKVTNAQELAHALNDSEKFQGQLMAEQWIQGEEYTVGILNNSPLPVIKLETPHDFYDFEAKYQSNDTQYILPCGLSVSVENTLKEKALAAFEATGATGWGRVDVMMDARGHYWFLEVNTVPGMTDHSLVPMAAADIGINFEQLVLKILDTTF